VFVWIEVGHQSTRLRLLDQQLPQGARQAFGVS
jgi:hypothetical protein